MIETIIMLVSLILLGYAFYISSRMFWSSRKTQGFWKWVYVIISFFILVTYFVFSIVFFLFIVAIVSALYIFELVNMFLGITLLSGAALTVAVTKHHISLMSSKFGKK
ncbi:MAG: hypothetical protein JSV63_00180 [Candidatus Aenigmatarchaeota archaeon]|nr:MAG: hypothetical protein JSV63_00180 [Candidatus Aenigmarchaeota archaeon]